MSASSDSFPLLLSQCKQCPLPLHLPFPDDDEAAVVAGGEKGLVVVEGDRQGGEGVGLQFVDAGLAGSGDVKEVNPAVLRGGDDTLPAPEGHQGGEAGPDVEVRVDHRELAVETETAQAVRDGEHQEAVVADIDQYPGVGGGGPAHDVGHLVSLRHQLPVALAELPHAGVHLEREHGAALSPGPHQVILGENIR